MIELILFYCFASLAVLAGFSVILSRNPVHAVLSLVGAFVATACLWLMLESEFLALVLVVVYVGAVMVLFLFVVMMLDIEIASHKASFVSYWAIALVSGVMLLALLGWALGNGHFGLKLYPETALPMDYNSTQVLGLQLFTHFVYPFEIAGALLLAAMIAAIALTFRGRKPGTKS
ncbi:MAG: NADH-quinone oxidoreductase subunit J, partial [Gammaproteobacteria bacterium]|nr:NADH-quinone oxidoreductase subunit J [Gammaproteobacteria bacterium]